MDAIDSYLKEYFLKEQKILKKGDRLNEYPSAKDLYAFVTSDKEGEAFEKMMQHLENHPEDEVLVTQARELLETLDKAEQVSVPSAWTKKAKALFVGKTEAHCPHCGKTITAFKKPLKWQNLLNIFWTVCSAAFFSLSFVLPHYFIQWVALGVIFGMKGIVDAKSTRTQIMIYKALRDDDNHSAEISHRLSHHLK